MPKFRNDLSFQNLTIRSKTLVASAILLLCLIGVGITVYTTANTVTDNLRQLSGSNLPTRAAASAVNNAVVAAHMKVFRYVSWASNGVNAKMLRSLYDEIDADFWVAQKTFDELSRRPDLNATMKADLSALQSKLKQYEQTAREVLDVGASDAPMATMMLGQTDDVFTNIESNIRKIQAATTSQSTTIVQTLAAAADTEKYSVAVGLIACLVFTLAGIALITKSIVKPIRSVTHVMQQLSAGNTDIKMRYSGPTGVGQQSAATAEISSNVQSVATGSRTAAANIVALNRQADATSQASDEVLKTTAQLFNHTHNVQGNVERFLRHVRSA